MARGGERSNLFGGTVKVLASEGLVLPTGLILSALLARTLGPDGYGVFALAMSIAGGVEWGIGSFLSRATVATIGASDTLRTAGAVLRWYLMGGLLAGTAVWLAAAPLAGAMDEPRVRTCLTILAFEMPLVALATGCRAILTGRGLFTRRAAAGAVRWVARLAGIGLLVAFGFSLTGAIVGSVMAAAVTLIVSWVLAGRPIPATSPVRLTGFWRVAASAFVLAMSLRLLDRLGLVALKFFGGSATDAGWYAAAQNFATAPGLFAVAFSPLLLATLTRMVSRGDHDAARSLGRDALRAVMLSVPVLVLIAGSAGEIVRLIYGASFAPAAQLAWPFLIAAAGISFIAVTSAVLTAAGHAREMSRSAWPILPTALIGYALVVPRAGAAGAAIVTCAATILGATLLLVSTRMLWRIAPPVSSCIRALGVAVAAYLLAVWWPTPGLWWFVKAIVGAAAIGGAYVVLGEVTKPERAFLLRQLRHTLGVRG